MDFNSILKISEELDDEKFKDLLIRMAEKYGRKFEELFNFFKETSIDETVKEKFLLRAISTIIKQNYDGDFYTEYIPYFLITCIQRNEEDFLDMITQDDSMQEQLIEYIKRFPKDSLDIFHIVSNLDCVKKEILDDEEFVIEQFSTNRELFEHLPNDYGHLICFYNSRYDRFNVIFLENLYKKHYGDILNRSEIMELIGCQYLLNLNNETGIDRHTVMQPLEFALIKMKEDKFFIEEIRTIKEKFKSSERENEENELKVGELEDGKDKSEIKTIEILQLLYNYYDTELYEDIIKTDEIDKELKEKILYISKDRSKIEGINTLQDLKNASLEELSKMERRKTYINKFIFAGGPRARTRENLFPDSTEREIRRINQDGTMHTELVRRLENHEDAVERLYEDDVDFPKNCKTALERSVEAAKQISSATFVIESEKCFIILPERVTYEQEKAIMELINTANSIGEFGVYVYDPIEGKPYPCKEEMVRKDEAKGLILGIDRDELDKKLDDESTTTQYENENIENEIRDEGRDDER